MMEASKIFNIVAKSYNTSENEDEKGSKNEDRL